MPWSFQSRVKRTLVGCAAAPPIEAKSAAAATTLTENLCRIGMAILLSLSIRLHATVSSLRRAQPVTRISMSEKMT